MGSKPTKRVRKLSEVSKKIKLFWSNAKNDESLMSAIKTIQKAYRLYRARQELRFRAAWRIFQVLTFLSHNELMDVAYFYSDLLDNFPLKKASSMVKWSMGTTFVDTPFEFGMDHVESVDFKTWLQIPLQRKGFEMIIKTLKKYPRGELPSYVVYQILRAATRKLEYLGNINNISGDTCSQVIVCGSLHGSLEDLLYIFSKYGYPSMHRPYVFNGDMVDYGQNGIEVLTLIMASFLVFSQSVFLNRGNHEDLVVNACYGFRREIRNKYSEHKMELFKALEDLYRWLPLATIISDSIIVVNGGFHGTMDLRSIRVLPRECFDSILCPTRGTFTNLEWQLIYDILWNEPLSDQKTKGNAVPEYLIGPKFSRFDTKQFLYQNKLNLLIISQKCLPDGFKRIHEGNTIVVSSVSNIFSNFSNNGSIVSYKYLLPAESIPFNFLNNDADLVKKIKTRSDDIEKAALKELLEFICIKRFELEQNFLLADKKRQGFITLRQWCDCLTTANNLKLPWYFWISELASSEQTISNEESGIFVTTDYFNETWTLLYPKKIFYERTLQLLVLTLVKINDPKKVSRLETICDNRKVQEQVFHLMDEKATGYITFKAFSETVQILENRCSGKYKASQMIEIFKLIDNARDGKINLHQFQEVFRLYEELIVSKFSVAYKLPFRKFQ